MGVYCVCVVGAFLRYEGFTRGRWPRQPGSPDTLVSCAVSACRTPCNASTHTHTHSSTQCGGSSTHSIRQRQELSAQHVAFGEPWAHVAKAAYLPSVHHCPEWRGGRARVTNSSSACADTNAVTVAREARSAAADDSGDSTDSGRSSAHSRQRRQWQTPTQQAQQQQQQMTTATVANTDTAGSAAAAARGRSRQRRQWQAQAT
jgi:hypothetical protein